METTALKDPSSEAVLFAEEKAGRFTLGFITLNQPRTLNALNLTILRSMEEKLLQWRNREDIACIVLHASSEGAFCAGGDIKALIAELQEDHDSLFAKDYFAAEYFVDYFIHVYPKPILCWADGISMGGGIGIMTGACCRVVTERSVLAMPEIAIGFFTDVGATYFLNRLPPGLGLFLGLTGARFEGLDAVALRLADRVVRSDKKKAVLSGLLSLSWTEDAQKNREILQRYIAKESELPAAGKSKLLTRLDEIQGLVDKADIDDIDAVFRNYRSDSEWMHSALRGYFDGSPSSAKTIFEQLQRGKALSPKEALLREWDMALDHCKHPDLFEGVRARVIDKSSPPRWNPPTLAEVRAEEIERYFSPLSGRLNLLRQKISDTGID